MRQIRIDNRLQINISHAATSNEGLTSINISMPLDAAKYMEGKNILECIPANLLPELVYDAINQILTDEEINLLQGLFTTATVQPYVKIVSGMVPPTFNQTNETAISWLNSSDNAINGRINLDLGSSQIRYT